MARKSMLYIFAGILLVLYTVISCMSNAMQITGIHDFKFKTLIMFIKLVGIKSIIHYAILLLIGLACIAKSVVGELVSDIAFLGLFGLMTLFTGITFLSYFIDMIKFHQLNTWIAWVNVFFQLFPIIAFGAMTGIILLKDGFGGLYFALAAIMLVQFALVVLLSGFIELTIMSIIMELLFIGGLFTFGKAATDN